ncbi:pyrroline-5-carboxylate reductase [Megalodesulfovibrio gigas]|uniref:Pyrroline-5-carboxylate reductase n=1 Tax=Megalodesulfovibrio gigas (strain ATCC 19364 / DSM 1382 / NCIMB 9332 / VKM B-1759) TaxID=1121448 RepID=T2GE45_MEGG1|nr:pyrroline-5-carboxylate reductase [Megalodesulfovibrio gigas]AGW14454.1 putative pyrroline-5-carboxylate reductase [Megalodesulfovibrio gigas DSM 1382 = ATCC 19364]
MEKTLGCLGCGNMGSAILRGLSGTPGLSLRCFDTDKTKLASLCTGCEVESASSVHDLAEGVDYLLVAIKPHQMHRALADLASRLSPSQVILSIAAGVGLDKLKRWCSGACPVVRVMPNTPAMVQAGMFAVCLDDPDLKDSQKEFVTRTFERLGRVFILDESRFDSFTALAGSGPAYVFYLMEAMVEAGVTMGFPRPQATDMVRCLFSGSAKLAQERPEHLSVLREMVTSPGGTTIAATNVLDRKAVRAALVDAVVAAETRSKELGG